MGVGSLGRVVGWVSGWTGFRGRLVWLGARLGGLVGGLLLFRGLRGIVPIIGLSIKQGLLEIYFKM